MALDKRDDIAVTNRFPQSGPENQAKETPQTTSPVPSERTMDRRLERERTAVIEAGWKNYIID